MLFISPFEYESLLYLDQWAQDDVETPAQLDRWLEDGERISAKREGAPLANAATTPS